MTKFKITCHDRQARESAVKCFSQKHNRIVRVGFEPRPFRSQSWRFNHSTTLLTMPQLLVQKHSTFSRFATNEEH